MTKVTGTTKRIHILGQNMRTLLAFSELLHKHGMDDIYDLTKSDKNADAVIIDIDDAPASEEWDKYKNKFPSRPSLIVSISPLPQNLNAHIFSLQKPFSFEKFSEFLDFVRDPDSKSNIVSNTTENTISELTQEKPPPKNSSSQSPDAPDEHSDTCGNMPNINASNDQEIEGKKLVTNGLLLGRVIQAINTNLENKNSFVLTGKSGICFYFNMEHDFVKSEQRNGELITNCQIEFTEDELEIIPVPHEDIEPDSLCESIDSLMWKLALWTYRGRLPEPLDPGKRVYLQCWPNFTRLLSIPNELRIAALLSRQAMNLLVVADMLKIPQRHVFSFYSAAHTIGIAGQAKRSADMLFESEKILTSINRDLYQKVIGKIGSTKYIASGDESQSRLH